MTKPSILYVEDEDTTWEVVHLTLAPHFDLQRARNAREAFLLLATNTYDVILMDIQLQGSEMNGIDIAQALKGRFVGKLPDYAAGFTRVGLPVIFVTAYAGNQARQVLMQVGGDDAIAKPIDFDLLKALLIKHTTRSAPEAFSQRSDLR